ncbi:hypothetical protein KI387_036088, partial [Taxus chinensis]
KIRQLTEIARIFTLLNLIRMENPDCNQGYSNRSFFSWQGARGVEERLEIADSPNKIVKRRCSAPKNKLKAVKNFENAMESMPELGSESEYDTEGFLPWLETDCNCLIKRPRLCAPAKISITEDTCAPILFKKGILKSSNPGKIGGRYFSSRFDAAKPLSPVMELENNDTDAVDFEVAAILLDLASSDQPNTINASHEIIPETPQKLLALTGIKKKSNCLSDAFSLSSSKCWPEQEFNPLCYLQHIFSPR